MPGPPNARKASMDFLESWDSKAELAGRVIDSVSVRSLLERSKFAVQHDLTLVLEMKCFNRAKLLGLFTGGESAAPTSAH